MEGQENLAFLQLSSLSTFLYACENWTLTAELARKIQALEMRCYRTFLNISCKDHVMNKEVRSRTQDTIGVHDDLLTIEAETQMEWPHFKILLHGEDFSAGDNNGARWRETQHNSKRNTTVKKKARTQERIDRNRVCRFPEGSDKQ